MLLTFYIFVLKCLQEDNSMIGKKIKYYRLKRGLTLDELATNIGCSKAAISLYENDEREPNVDIIKKIAKALGISWASLIDNDTSKLNFVHIGFRKKQSVPLKDVELLKLDIERECLHRIEVLDLLGITKRMNFKAKQLSIKDKPNDNALIIRKCLNLNPNGPIYSLVDCLENAGVILLTFESNEEIFGLNGTVNGIPYIFYNSKINTIERRRFTIAHELCHLFFIDNEDVDEKELEKYINKVAACLLVPDEDLYEMFGRTNHHMYLYIMNEAAKKYRVAPSCLVNRLYEAGIITKLFQKKFFIALNKTVGKNNEPSLINDDDELEETSLFEYNVYLALSEELISASKAAEYLNVPLYDVMLNVATY